LRRRLNALLDSATGAVWMVPLLREAGGRFSALSRIQRARRNVDEMLTALLERRRSTLNAERPDVLSMLIEASRRGDGLSDDEIRDEMVTLLLAGHETTATALSWTTVLMLQHRRVYTRVKEELGAALADGQPLAGKLESLQYLDATIREALRLNPVIPDIGRKVMWPIRIGGWDLPVGAIAVPSIDLTHRNPAVWPQPERFRPERFLERRPTPYEFFPFGGGIRRCIGMSFALFETKAVLARVLARCEVRIAPGYRPRMTRRAITMVPSKGAPVVMDRRIAL
jgi:cytochrome P450